MPVRGHATLNSTAARSMSKDSGYLMTKQTKDELLIALAVAFASAVLFALNIDFLMRGDAATYANYVLLSKFDDLTLHIGYYAVVWLADRVIGRALNVPLHEMLAWVNVACGALAMGVSYLLARKLLGGRAVALMVVLMLLLSGRVISNATSSEIYMLQTLLVLLAMLAYVHDRPVIAGMCAASALLVSPLSAFAFLFFPVYEFTKPQEQRQLLPLVWMLGAGTLVYAPYLITFGEELFWGRRGLLVISNIVPVSLSVALRNVPLYQFKHYTVMLLLLAPALLMVRRHTRFVLLTLAVALPHIYIVLKLTGENNVFILNTDFFFAGWLALGVVALWERGRWQKWLGLAPVVAHVALLLASRTVFNGVHNEGYATELRQIAQERLVGKPAVMIADWDVVMSTTYFGRDSAAALLEEEPLSRQLYDVDKPSNGQPSLKGVELFLLDFWSAGALRSLLSSEESIAAVELQSAVVNRARRSLGLECAVLERGTHILYRCSHPDSSLALPKGL